LNPAAAEYREVARLMQAREWHAAQSACGGLNARYPTFAAGWMAASQIALARKVPAEALDAIGHALALEPENPRYLIHRAQCLLALGRTGEALASAEAAGRGAGADADAWDAIGALRSYARDQRGALAAYERAVALAPENPQFLYNRASVRRFMGDLEGAETDYDRVIAQRPTDFEAYLNRSELRVQRRERNHIAELEAILPRTRGDWRGEVQIRFALAKECEDLGEYARSFEYLRSGAKTRREHLKYGVATDVATVDWIMQAFPAALLAGAAGADCAGFSSPAGRRSTGPDDPVFIVGMPRSGTTLVERILGSHSAVSSAGELDCFALALVEAARRHAGPEQLSRRELVAASASLDFAALGTDYLKRARAVFGGAGRFIDKMPLNYLYCGLIGRALPNARIIHVTRHPMAVCYAMYKTLFKNGYPFSYDLGEIAEYYIAYRRLMSHWHAAIPGAIYELSYESLVADQRGETIKLLEYCDLEWEDGCFTFHRNPAPTTTASASQVRRPIYDSSVSQWRHYESELGELSARLTAAGIDLG
jgi:tetratricopeptide (TPR) repeat protein